MAERRHPGAEPRPPTDLDAFVAAGQPLEASRGSSLSSADLDALFAEVTRQTRALDRTPLGWIRARTTPTRIVGLLLTCAALAVSVALLFPRPDLGVYPGPRFALTVAALVGLAGWLAARALRPLHRPAPSPAAALAPPVAALAVLVVLALLPAAHADHPVARLPGGAAAWHVHLACLFEGIVFSVPVLVAGRILDRGGRETVWAATALAGVTANLVLFVACPVTAPGHLLVGHAGVAAAMLLGAAGFRVAADRLAARAP